MFGVTSCSMQGVTSDFSENANTAQEVYITLEGGSGKAHVESPVTVETRDGKLYATLVWSSKNYDYVLVDGVRYENENPGGPSTFTVQVRSLDEPFSFIGDTVAMSTPHEIEYTIIWNTGGKEDAGAGDDDEETDGNKGFGNKPDGYKDPDLLGLSKTGEVALSYAKGCSIN